MDKMAGIRAMIEQGKIAEQEGLAMMEAYAQSEARDRVLQDEMHKKRGKQRSRSLGRAVTLGLLASILAGFFFVFTSNPSSSPDQPGQVERVAQQLLGQDVNLLIQRLEVQLRKPGTAWDYRLLGMAYEKRYEQSQVATDRERGLEMIVRAERLERRAHMKGNPAVFGILFVLIVVVAMGVWVMMLYNGLARGEETIDERWAQVDVVLQRRLDLVPQLIETVRGYATHERETLLAVTESRAKVLGILEGVKGEAPQSADTIQQLSEAQQDMGASLARLLALAERYPDLKANSNFLALQDQLEGSENRISVERQRYNAAVKNYNGGLRVFPSNVVGNLFGYTPREYFESKVGAENPVAVSFK